MRSPRAFAACAPYIPSFRLVLWYPARELAPSAERAPPARGTTYEPGLRDQEWALAQLAGEAMADLGRVAALGHGGGGLTAVLLAERQAGVRRLWLRN